MAFYSTKLNELNADATVCINSKGTGETHSSYSYLFPHLTLYLQGTGKRSGPPSSFCRGDKGQMGEQVGETCQESLRKNLSNVPGAFSEALTCRRMESVPEPGLDGDKKEMPDRINNHELVDVASPFSGVYTVTVLGHSIPEGPQCFALVFVLVSFSHSLLFFFTFLLTRFSSGEFLHGDAFQNDMRNDMRS